jgi:hypothetical protein
MSVIKKLIATLSFIFIYSNLTGTGAPTPDANALKEFDAAVGQSRVEIRQYCALASTFSALMKDINTAYGLALP